MPQASPEFRKNLLPDAMFIPRCINHDEAFRLFAGKFKISLPDIFMKYQLFFFKPQMVRLPPLERIGPLGPVRVERSIKLLPVGAMLGGLSRTPR